MEQHVYPLSRYRDLLAEHGLIVEEHLNGDPTIGLVSCNSREVTDGTLFICKGAHFKEQYLLDAIHRGAVVYVSETVYPAADVAYIRVSDIRKAMALLANLYYEQAWTAFDLIGITGTKGKSSTAYYVKHILDEYLNAVQKPNSAIISSIDTYDGVIFEESHLTTPESIDLHKHFANTAKSGIPYLTMEVSSQALKYDRVTGVTFDVGCFLNIGRDHISPVEHPDFEDYFASKRRLMAQCRTACINLDADRADEVVRDAAGCERIITFGSTPNADVYGYDVRKAGNDILFKVRTATFDREFRLTMPGLFNVQNALAAIAVAIALDIPETYMVLGLVKARVAGRMEVFTSRDNRVTAIVDYAHNKLSFEKLFESVAAEYPHHRVITIFGCPGRKAQERRRDLGEISGRYSDLVYVTEEDHGEEPLLDICKEIAVHVDGAHHAACRIQPDRGEAITEAILTAETDTVILITGKGRETRQKRGIEYIPCKSDVQFVEEALALYETSKEARV